MCPFQTRSDKTVGQKNKHCDEQKSNKSNNDEPAKLKFKPSTIGNTKSITEVTAVSVSISILAKNNITNIIDTTMTRKTRNKPVRDATIDACSIKTNNDDVKPNSEKCGYCEKCRVEYDVLAAHLQSKEHLNFVKNNDNYIALDSLINSGTNVENFLRLNSGQMIDESERNGMHSPKRDSLITSRVNYLSHTKLDEANKGDAAKSHKQMNGVAHHSDGHHHQQQKQSQQISPSKLNNIRGNLPKYSPPITRRSQTKNSIQVALDDSQTNDITKPRPEKLNSITVDFKDEINFISKPGKISTLMHHIFNGFSHSSIQF